MKIAAGLVEADTGERFIKPATTIRYLPQDPDLSAFNTISDYIRDGLVGADTDHQIPYLLGQLGLDPDTSTSHLSGGEARRAALVRILAPQPDILLLDEPTNHLDLPAIEWLETELRSMPSALVLISHDRRFLETLSRRTIWMDRGETRDIDKSFKHFEDWRDTFLEHEALERHKLNRKIHREQHWVIHGVSGRRKRNVRRLKELGELRKQVKEQRQVTGQVQFSVDQGSKSGKRVARLERIFKSFGDQTVMNDFSIKISRGERIGLIGPNGSGKTTLLKLIMGEIDADSGEIELGVNLKPLVIDQKRESLDPDWTLSDALTDGTDTVQIGDKTVHVMRYMKDFLFLPEQARTPVHALSGGERGRLQLARGLRHHSNLLILDEPTNDLDMETLDLLQELIADYDGTVILVSHDRDFIDRCVTRTIVNEGPGKWQIYAGGYSDMMAQRKSTEALPQVKKAGRPKPANDKQSSGKNKLSYKHKFRLEKIPGEISACETLIKQLETKLAEPAFFSLDPKGFASAAAELKSLTDKLDALETEWLELEALKDSQS
jgi:ATP-binding cassette subfamily F protein uup